MCEEVLIEMAVAAELVSRSRKILINAENLDIAERDLALRVPFGKFLI